VAWTEASRLGPRWRCAQRWGFCPAGLRHAGPGRGGGYRGHLPQQRPIPRAGVARSRRERAGAAILWMVSWETPVQSGGDILGAFSRLEGPARSLYLASATVERPRGSLCVCAVGFLVGLRFTGESRAPAPPEYRQGWARLGKAVWSPRRLGFDCGRGRSRTAPLGKTLPVGRTEEGRPPLAPPCVASPCRERALKVLPCTVSPLRRIPSSETPWEMRPFRGGPLGVGGRLSGGHGQQQAGTHRAGCNCRRRCHGPLS
jgi:hypothetical protein